MLDYTTAMRKVYAAEMESLYEHTKIMVRLSGLFAARPSLHRKHLRPYVSSRIGLTTRVTPRSILFQKQRIRAPRTHTSEEKSMLW
jgi:hypothetical protein